MVHSCWEYILYVACSYLTYVNVEVSGKTEMQLITFYFAYILVRSIPVPVVSGSTWYQVPGTGTGTIPWYNTPGYQVPGRSTTNTYYQHEATVLVYPFRIGL